MTELLYLVGGLLAGGLLAAAFFRWRPRRDPDQSIVSTGTRLAEGVQARLQTVQKLNRSLVEARDESQLLTELMALMISSTKTAGASYIPMDEMGQPLAQINQGITPRYPYQPWTARLATAPVNDVCRACQKLHKGPHADCPLADNPFVNEGEITCLPIQRGSRRLGMINLFHHPGQVLDSEDVSFFNGFASGNSMNNLIIYRSADCSGVIKSTALRIPFECCYCIVAFNIIFRYLI